MVVTYETVRQWCLKFGQTYANALRSRRPRWGDKWYMDEVMLSIRGQKHILCEPLIRTATCSTSSSRAAETQKLPNDFSASSSKGSHMFHVSSSLISSGAMVRRNASSCLAWSIGSTKG